MLQVEGASIDKRDHAADLCGQIGETLAFDNAIGVALDYQAQHPDTLVVVTADHSHTSQMTYTTGVPATGASYATVQTVDNTPIRVSYGTDNTGTGATTSGSQHHTGAEVPVWASGPRAADIQGTIDQTDIFSVLTNVRGPAGAADTTQVAPVGGSVPATLNLALGTRGHVPAVPARRRARLRGVDDRDRDLQRRRRGAQRDRSQRQRAGRLVNGDVLARATACRAKVGRRPRSRRSAAPDDAARPTARRRPTTR